MLSQAKKKKPSDKRFDEKDFHRKSRFRLIGYTIFWTLCVVVQWYLLRIYHDTAFGIEAEVEAEAEIVKKDDKYLRKQNENRQTKPSRQIEGIFNGYPIYKHANQHNEQGNLEELYSQFHCVGETWRKPQLHKRSKTYHEESWQYRSCHFHVMCYDTEIQDYVVYLDPEKHVSSRKDHHYHDEVPSSELKPHPSPLIENILEMQRKKLEQNNSTKFKHATFFDDTSTVYRNHTIVVDGNGEVLLGDTENGKHYGVSIGALNSKWGLVDMQLLKWWPTVRWGPVPGSSNADEGSSSHDAYTLPSSVIMIPFHSMSAENPGHLMWDDLLPMHTLLGMFGFLPKTVGEDADDDDRTNGINDAVDLLPIRYKLWTDRGLWAGCDWTNDKIASCNNMLNKFGTLVGTRRSYRKFLENEDENNTTMTKSAATKPRIPITTNRDVLLFLHGKRVEIDSAKSNGTGKNQRRRLQQSERGDTNRKSESAPSKPKLICAKNALVGFGGVSDHMPFHGHGWEREDYYNSHNAGRGGQAWEFRNFMVHNLFEHFANRTIEAKPVSHFSEGRSKHFHSALVDEDERGKYPPSSITDLGPDEPLLVVFSDRSSTRRVNVNMSILRNDIAAKIKEAGGPYAALYGRKAAPGDVGADVDIVLEQHTMFKYTLEEQVHLASRAAIYVTTNGGGTMTAAFLPRGAALTVYFYEDGGIEHNKKTNLPARLDWDYWNNLGYTYVDWIPATQRKIVIPATELWLDHLRRIHMERVRHHKEQQAATK